MNILIRNCTVVPMDESVGAKYYTGSVGISGGKIAFAGADTRVADEFRSDCGDDLKIIDGEDMVLIPGLINTHNHAAMTLLRSYADDIPLMSWLNDHVWPFEAKMTARDVGTGTRLAIAEMLLGGTTTFADMYWYQDTATKAAEETGIRMVSCPTFTDDKFGDFLSDFDKVQARYGKGQNPKISLMVAPHSVYTCSEENLRTAARMAKERGIGMTIHTAETQDEIRIIRERHGMTPVELMESYGLLSDRTLAVHCVHISGSDMEILRKYGCGVAHNPQSNMKISSGTAPVAEMIARGLEVSIGTDGPCSNNDLDMIDEMRSASFLQKLATMDPCVLPAYEVLKMATVNGARALGLQDRVGMVRPGMEADIVLFDTRKPHWFPRHDLIANIIYSAKSTDVDTVIVGGDILVAKGRILAWDPMPVAREAEAITCRIRNS